MTRTSKIAFLVAAILLSAIFGYRYVKEWRTLRNFPPEVADIFFKSSEVELFSLSTDYNEELAPDNFHGFNILGSVKLSDRGLLTRMARDLDKAVDTNDMTNVRCFWPRHGIRTTVDGKIFELVICFECHRLLLYVDGEFKFKTDLNSTPKLTFNKPLSDAGVKINTPVKHAGF